MDDFEVVRKLLHTNISWTFPQQDIAIFALSRIEAEVERLRAERDEWERKFWAEKEAYRSVLKEGGE
jgi:hypothetical protein